MFNTASFISATVILSHKNVSENKGELLLVLWTCETLGVGIRNKSEFLPDGLGSCLGL